MTERPHDAIFKAGFEKPEHASGIFRALLPGPLRDAIAWETARAEHGSFIDPALADSHSDLLFSVQLAGRPAFLYLLLEHQSTSDSDMPLRVLAYMVRIWERFRSEHARERVRRPLPPILPAVISHVPGGWTTARSFDDLLDPAPSSIPGLADLVPRFSLLIEDLAHLSNDAIKSRTLAAFPKLVLWALRDARGGDELLANFSHWRTAFAEAAAAPRGVEALAQLLRYITLVTDDLQLDEFRAKLETIGPEAEEAAMTIAEQMRREGLAEGRLQVIKNLLRLKFGAIDGAIEARLVAATPADLDRYVERILTADSLAAVFA